MTFSVMLFMTNSLVAMERAQREIYISIDSGGALGVIPAYLLNNLEENTGKKVINMVDGLAGISTGGIIIGLLASGYSAGEARAFYHQHAQEIFGAALGGALMALFGGQNTQAALPFENLLEEKIGMLKLSEAKKPLFILSSVNGEVITFDSTMAKSNAEHNTTLKEVVRATASLPVLWPAAKVVFDSGKVINCVDAGVCGANDPTPYLYEKLRAKGNTNEMVIYSLGTGFYPASKKTQDLIANNDKSHIKVIRLEPNLQDIPGYAPTNTLMQNLFAANASPQQLKLLEERAQQLIDSEEYALMEVELSMTQSF